MENLTQRWTQSGTFFPKSKYFFLIFKKGQGRPLPIPSSGTPVSMTEYPSLSPSCTPVSVTEYAPMSLKISRYPEYP